MIVHDSKRNLNSPSFFRGQQIPPLNDLPLLTGNDYGWHARPYNEVRIKGFTDWISDVQRCSTFFFPDTIMWALAKTLKLLALYIIMHYL